MGYSLQTESMRWILSFPRKVNLCLKLHEVGRCSGSDGGRLPRLISLVARCVGAAALLWAAGSVFPCQTKPFPGHRGGISKHLPAGAVAGRAASGNASALLLAVLQRGESPWGTSWLQCHLLGHLTEAESIPCEL